MLWPLCDQYTSLDEPIKQPHTLVLDRIWEGASVYRMSLDLNVSIFMHYPPPNKLRATFGVAWSAARVSLLLTSRDGWAMLTSPTTLL